MRAVLYFSPLSPLPLEYYTAMIFHHTKNSLDQPSYFAAFVATLRRLPGNLPFRITPNNADVNYRSLSQSC